MYTEADDIDLLVAAIFWNYEEQRWLMEQAGHIRELIARKGVTNEVLLELVAKKRKEENDANPRAQG